MNTPDPLPLDAAVERKLVWKSQLMQRYSVALVQRGLDLAEAGTPYFNSDDAPEWAMPGDKTTIGAATRLLLAAGVLVPFRENIPELGIWGGIRKSRRECCNGHRNQLYRLASLPLAREFLERNGVHLPAGQLQLAI